MMAITCGMELNGPVEAAPAPAAPAMPEPAAPAMATPAAPMAAAAPQTLVAPVVISTSASQNQQSV